jgi:hypothetical protein
MASFRKYLCDYNLQIIIENFLILPISIQHFFSSSGVIKSYNPITNVKANTVVPQPVWLATIAVHCLSLQMTKHVTNSNFLFTSTIKYDATIKRYMKHQIFLLVQHMGFQPADDTKLCVLLSFWCGPSTNHSQYYYVFQAVQSVQFV